MNRAIPLLIATAAIGGGLAFFALKTSPTGPIQDLNDDPIDMSEESSPPVKVASEAPASAVNLVDVGEGPRASMVATGGRAKAWEIIPINSVGQRIDTANIKAVPSSEVGNGIPPLEAVGRIKWEDVPSGIWTLTVTAEDTPTWTRDVEVRANRTTRTPVAMGPEIRITGVLRDSNGAALSHKTPVFLLPKNAMHPTLGQRRGKAKSGKVELPGGVIAAQTDNKGRFQARLPEAGEYRISVGDIRSADTPRWAQEKPFELTYGGPDHIVATVPARPELTVRFSGPKEERPTAVAAYVYDADRAAQMARRVDKSPGELSNMSLEEAQKNAKAKALKGLGYAGGDEAGGKDGSPRGGSGRGKAGGGARGKAGGRGGQGTARTMSEENRRMQEQNLSEQENLGGRVEHAPLFDPGWRSIGSRPVTAEGEVLFTDLPEREDIRFLFIRGSERITSMAPIRMRAQQRGIGTVSLPTPAPASAPKNSNLASVKVTDRPTEDDAPTLAAGVEWTISKR